MPSRETVSVFLRFFHTFQALGRDGAKEASPGRGERRFDSTGPYAPTGLPVCSRRAAPRACAPGLRPGLSSSGPPGLKPIGRSDADLRHEVLAVSSWLFGILH